MLEPDTLSGTLVNSGMMGCPGQPIVADECIEAGRQASERLKAASKHAWADWLLVGKAWQHVRSQAMFAAQTNQPSGRRFSQQCSDLLKRAGLDWIDKGTRSRLLDCLEHHEEIDAYLAKLPPGKRLKTNHPNAVWRGWQASISQKPTQPKQSPIAQLKEENARLRREVESGGGDLWAPTDTAKDIAMVIRSKVSPSKAKAIADELKRLVKEG
jgi:hypothetical protein